MSLSSKQSNTPNSFITISYASACSPFGNIFSSASTDLNVSYIVPKLPVCKFSGVPFGEFSISSNRLFNANIITRFCANLITGFGSGSGFGSFFVFVFGFGFGFDSSLIASLHSPTSYILSSLIVFNNCFKPGIEYKN